jgi:hypothetical protein
MLYAYDENFVLVLSHDEVVHGKGSMINKMPGDRWQKFANLRMLYAWMWAHPGKKLLFMGCEFGQWQEWNHERSLDWHLFLGEEHASMQKLIKDLNWLYTTRPAMHALDHEAGGFQWLDASDGENSIFAFMRMAPDGDKVYCIINATRGIATTGIYHTKFDNGGLHQLTAGISFVIHWKFNTWQQAFQNFCQFYPHIKTKEDTKYMSQNCCHNTSNCNNPSQHVSDQCGPYPHIGILTRNASITTSCNPTSNNSEMQPPNAELHNAAQSQNPTHSNTPKLPQQCTPPQHQCLNKHPPYRPTFHHHPPTLLYLLLPP